MITYNDIQQLTTDGAQLANTATQLRAVASGKHVEIKTIILHNTNTTTENVALYIGGTTDPYKIAYIGLEANETYEFSPAVPFVLYDNIIYGVTTTASKVNVRMMGRQEA